MTSNCEAISAENRGRYGPEGEERSENLAAGPYGDRRHFIFELRQSAEEALGRCGEAIGGLRAVRFALNTTRLTLSHFGKPFDEFDVKSVCGIAESTRNESSISHFDLGFNAVCTNTDLREIHSGDEDFAERESNSDALLTS